MSEAERKEPEGIALHVDWHIPEGAQSQYSNNVLVQAGQYEIIISFFEAQIPILLGQPEENKKQLEELGTIRVDCVSRIVVSPDLIPILMKALETGLENYRQAKSLLAEEG